MGIEAVIFDLGGVVMDSPLQAILRYERELGLSKNAINRAIVAAGEDGVWSRLERGELRLDEFFEPFEAECLSAGLTVDARRMMEHIASAGTLRPRMLEAIRRIRAEGLSVAALTNNWRGDASGEGEERRSFIRAQFDVFVESAVVGLRKPDPRIYELVCRELGVKPHAAAFLDDIGLNLKAARALGMTTIKVEEPDEALRELSQVLGLGLL